MVQGQIGTNLKEMVGRRYKPLAEYLGPVFREKSIVMVHAYRGVGKSWFVIGCAHALCSGSSFLKWKAPRPLKVALVDCEMGEQPIFERTSIIDERASESMEAENFRLLTYEHCENTISWNIGEPADQRRYSEWFGDADVVFLDNWAGLARPRPRETETDMIYRIQPWLVKEARTNGRCIVIVHHSGKNFTQRGSSQKEDPLDSVINLRHPAGYSEEEGCVFDVIFEKSRGVYGPGIEPVRAYLTPRGFEWSSRSTAIEDTVLQLDRKGYTKREIAQAIDVDLAFVRRILEAREEEKTWHD